MRRETRKSISKFMATIPRGGKRLFEVALDRKKTDRLYVQGKNDLHKLIVATVELHHDPGINPHNGNSTARLESIEVRWFIAQRYWWATPGLKEKLNSPQVFDLAIFESSTWNWPEEIRTAEPPEAAAG